jgi:hypothetical protein
MRGPARALAGKRREEVHVIRTTLVAAAVLAASSSLACAKTAAPPAASAGSSPPPNAPPVSVAYRVARSGDGAGVVLSGRTQVNAHRATAVKTLAAHSSAGEQLELAVLPREDGTLLVEVKYDEVSPEGARLRWEPSLRLARGTPGRAEVVGPGWGREIEVTVE